MRRRIELMFGAAVSLRMGTRRHKCAGICATALLLGFSLCVAATSSRAEDEPPVPVEAFYRHPDIDGAALSPDGTQLAILTGGRAPRVRLGIFDLKKRAAWMVAQFADADVRDFYWVNDRLLVFDLNDLSVGGGKQESLGLWAAQADGGAMRRIARDRMLLSVPVGGGNEIIVGRVARHAGEPIAIYPYKLDLTTGEQRSLAVDAPDYALSWIFEPKGEPRVVLATHEGQTHIHWRAPGDDTWTEIAKFDSQRMGFAPRFVDATGRLYVTAPEGGESYAVLKRFDFTTGKPEPDTFFKTPGFDFSGALITADGTGTMLGARSTSDALTTVWLDERMKTIQQDVDARLPGHINILSCRKCATDDVVVLVFSYSDRDPGQYFFYRPSLKKWEPVGRVRPDIDPQRMGTLELHRIRARDGLELPVWVTRPAGDRSSARPAVVLVHGGPWSRGESWRWSADAQFLASRGYVVIGPEFRGSTGYGYRLFHAGWKQWGRAMQDDVDDALDWVVGQGWVDAKHVCIAGASYGGYATLMGLIRTPERYRCGVAWAAVTDPRLLFEGFWRSEISEEARLYGLPVLIGDPKEDAAALAAVSPVEQASRIKAPLLLAFGGLDRRVPLEHGTRLRSALRAAGQDPQWVVYDDEGHGWLKPENRVDFARRMEAFLAKYLK